MQGHTIDPKQCHGVRRWNSKGASLLVGEPPAGILPSLNLPHCPTTLNRSTATVCGETRFIIRGMVTQAELGRLPFRPSRILSLGARPRGKMVAEILVGS